MPHSIMSENSVSGSPEQRVIYMMARGRVGMSDLVWKILVKRCPSGPSCCSSCARQHSCQHESRPMRFGVAPRMGCKHCRGSAALALGAWVGPVRSVLQQVTIERVLLLLLLWKSKRRRLVLGGPNCVDARGAGKDGRALLRPPRRCP
ncbi:unnamed protein product, partial [Amoebophrya sp. A120]|eukprot:GSA120T00010207001.1